MANNLNRRSFLQQAVIASTAAVSVSSAAENLSPAAKSFPSGKIGKLTVSRLILGGNLIAGVPHSRDLIYVGAFLKHYHTETKALETLQKAEANGINTTTMPLADATVQLLKKHWKERGGKIQWFAEVNLEETKFADQVKQAADAGAMGIVTHALAGEGLLKAKKISVLEKTLELAGKNGLVAGIGAHDLALPMACEEMGMKPDFYMKTFNSKRYWSADIEPRKENVFDEKPQSTIAFMSEVTRPWIAIKVLAAGSIQPRQGFQYAYENGADFLSVGMCDFQIEEDAGTARSVLEKTRSRSRPWSA